MWKYCSASSRLKTGLPHLGSAGTAPGRFLGTSEDIPRTLCHQEDRPGASVKLSSNLKTLWNNYLGRSEGRARVILTEGWDVEAAGESKSCSFLSTCPPQCRTKNSSPPLLVCCCCCCCCVPFSRSVFVHIDVLQMTPAPLQDRTPELQR